MELIEVTDRHRNDFSWIGKCRNCGHVEHYGDGYADYFYCAVVVPHRLCPKCRLDCYGRDTDAQQADHRREQRETENA